MKFIEKSFINLVATSILLFGLGVTAYSAQTDELPRRGFMGISLRGVSEEVRAMAELPAGRGVLVMGVLDGGTGKESGLQPQDVILRVGATDITGVEHFVSLVKSLRAGSEIEMTLWRAGERMVKRVKIMPAPPETNPAYDVIYRSVIVDGSRRRIIVTKPKGATGKRPALFIVGGIGCSSLDNLPPESSYAKLFAALSRDGYVTVRVEKTGMGDSEGPACLSAESDLKMEVETYIAALRAVKNYDFVDPANVALLGHSMGGTIAPFVAAREPVKGIIVAEAVSKTWREYLIENLRRQLVLGRVPYDEIERRVRENQLCLDRVAAGGPVGDQSKCDYIRAFPRSLPYLRQTLAADIAAEWKKVDVPLLLIYGTSDYVTSAEEHHYYAAMVNSFHPGRAQVALIEGMDHGFYEVASQQESHRRNNSQSAPETPHPKLVEEVRRWLAANIQKPDAKP